MMNSISKNKNALTLKISFLSCLLLSVISCDTEYKNGFQQSDNEGSAYPYIAYNFLMKDKLNGEVHGSDAYFLYPIDESILEVYSMVQKEGQKNFGFAIEDRKIAGCGELVVKKDIISINTFPISIPVNIKETRSWVGPGPYGPKCTSTYGKRAGDSVNIDIECIEDHEPFTDVPGRDISKGIWNSKRGLIYYLTPEGSSICPMQLKSKYGLFSPKFFEFYRTKSREIAAKSKSGKPADVIPDIVY
jgi:hypothetical protein